MNKSKMVDLTVVLALVLLCGVVSAQPLNLLEELGGVDGLARFALFMLIGTVGMVAHYVKKWLRGEIQGSLIDYMFRVKPKGTLLAFGALLTAAGSMLLANQLDSLTAVQIITQALTAGYACDSAANEGNPA